MCEVNRILITGADGNLGGKMTRLLADGSEYGVVAVSSFPDRIPAIIKREHIQNTDKIIQLSSDEMFTADLSQYNIIGVVHFAFSRRGFPDKDIASSLDYSLAAFRKIVASGIQNAIYASSQGVYGNTPAWRDVNCDPAPNNVHTMAKYAGEKLFEAVYMDSKLQHAIIRLDFVIQSQNLVKALCRNVKENGTIFLKGGNQVFSYLDADDVPEAILALLETKNRWRPVYNVGPDRMRLSLLEVAETVKKVAASEGYEAIISLEEDDTVLWAGMNSREFMDDTGWKPSTGIFDMIHKIFISC